MRPTNSILPSALSDQTPVCRYKWQARPGEQTGHATNDRPDSCLRVCLSALPVCCGASRLLHIASSGFLWPCWSFFFLHLLNPNLFPKHLPSSFSSDRTSISLSILTEPTRAAKMFYEPNEAASDSDFVLLVILTLIPLFALAPFWLLAVRRTALPVQSLPVRYAHFFVRVTPPVFTMYVQRI